MNSGAKTNKHLEIYWFTITYKQIVIWGGVLALLVGIGSVTLFKDYLFSKVNQVMAVEGATQSAPNKKTGSFIRLDGTVRVKKYNDSQWFTADFDTPLDAGDYIQTSPKSMARILFPDGTTYTMKSDSLIVVQENWENPRTRQKKISVRVTSGAIDLATPRRDSVGSTSEVSAASATALVQEASRMAVELNPSMNLARLSLHKGSAEVRRGKETFQLAPFEKITVEDSRMVKEKLLAPPQLVKPNNIKAVIVPRGKTSRVQFEWKPVSKAVGYKIRISNSSLFSKVLREEVVRRKTRFVTWGLEEGTYYWTVSSFDVNDQFSRESDVNKFTIISASPNQGSEMLLTIEVLRISNIFEIKGRTDPGAKVVINGEPVTLMSGDGSFKHITSPFRRGRHLIRVTAEDRSGHSKTLRREVFVD